jgi:hypothetical protein
MNVQHHYQILLLHSMGQLTNVAQSHNWNADRQVTQIVELQALVTQKDEIIAARDETILHREDQINESNAIITQRNTIIEFLLEQIHDLILEADDAQTHIEELQQPPVPPAAPQYLEVEKKIRKKMRESQTSTPSMETRSPILSQITLHLAISLV